MYTKATNLIPTWISLRSCIKLEIDLTLAAFSIVVIFFLASLTRALLVIKLTLYKTRRTNFVGLTLSTFRGLGFESSSDLVSHLKFPYGATNNLVIITFQRRDLICEVFCGWYFGFCLR